LGGDVETDFAYDKAGRQTSVTDDLSNVTTTAYSGTRRASVTDALNNKTQFVYDTQGRVVRTQMEDSIFDGNGTAQPSYIHVGYDQLGRRSFETELTATTNPNVAVRKDFEYDAFGRLTAVVLGKVDDPNDDPDLGETVRPRFEFSYDIYGNQDACVKSFQAAAWGRENSVNGQQGIAKMLLSPLWRIGSANLIRKWKR